MIYQGYGAEVEVKDDVIGIRRFGLGSTLALGFQGEKKIYIGDITAVQFREPGFMNGYIHFSFMGAQEVRGGVLAHATDENSVMFAAEHAAGMNQLREFVEKRIAELRASKGHTAAPSAADEIEKLGKLRDSGLLTEEEFTTKKRQLLGI